MRSTGGTRLGQRLVPSAIALAAAVALSAAALDLPPQLSTLAGGSGGTSVNVNCGTHRVLVGVSGRAGGWLDNLFLTCAFVDGAKLTDVKTVSGRIGGTGGLHDYSVKCPSGQVVKGLMVYRGWYITQIGLYCRAWNGTEWSGVGNLVGPVGGSGGSYDRRDCDSKAQPVVGLRARAGFYVDAVGIRCDEP
jgi:hypothetical protein